MRVQRALCALVLATLPVASFAQGFAIPPAPDHFVTDNAGVLSASASASIENELQAYERATGHQVIVWIGQSTGDVPLETWTGETAGKWKVGRRGHDDGAVLFLFMHDRKIRIEVGYGLESALTDADSYRIITDVIRPKMRANDVDGAVSGGVAAMLTTITPGYAGVTPPPGASSSSESIGNNIFFAIFALLFFGFGMFMVVMSIVRNIRYGYLVMREGRVQANRDMGRSAFWTGGFIGGLTSGGGGGGGFSGGGGGFGGGGASGGW
ncbi:MAG: TPM domain-containing protein [Candidatus Cybelea sp.]